MRTPHPRLSEESVTRAEFIALKQDFYELCGLLSISEIMSNSKLIQVLERIQKKLLTINDQI